MHSDFDPNTIAWLSLIEGPPQYGGGSYSPFVGLPYQRGAGIGSIFRSLLRFLIPIGKEAGTAIGRQGLESGIRVLSGALAGQPIKQTLEDEGRSGLKNLLDKASNNLAKKNDQSGGSFDFKRYKKITGPSAGLNTFQPELDKKSINKGKKLLQSTIGPSLLPTRKRKHSHKSSVKQRKLRIDSLGVY